MHEFTALNTVPSDADMQNLRPNSPVTFAEQLWMKIWDVCVNRGAHHWAVTTYDDWVFGGFSDGWSTGSVSAIRSRDTASPITVLQQFLAWIGASLSLSKEMVIRSVPESTHNVGVVTEPAEWNSPDELARDDTWSCPSDASQRYYWDPNNLNPLYPKAPGTVIASKAAAAREVENNVYDRIPEPDRISVYSMETTPIANEIERPMETSRQAKRYEQDQKARFEDWLTKPKFMTGLAQPHPEEPRFEDPTEAEVEMMWAAEKKYFNYNPFTPERIARLPHLPIESVHASTEEERIERVKNWVSVSDSTDDPNKTLPEQSLPENAVTGADEVTNAPKGAQGNPFDLSAEFVHTHDKKPIVLAAATELGPCERSIHSNWSMMPNAIQQPFGELLGHVDNGADSVRDMLVES